MLDLAHNDEKINVDFILANLNHKYVASTRLYVFPKPWTHGKKTLVKLQSFHRLDYSDIFVMSSKTNVRIGWTTNVHHHPSPNLEFWTGSIEGGRHMISNGSVKAGTC